MQDTPYHVLDNSTYQGRRLLDIAHKQLMAYHTAKNITFPAAVYNSLPTQAVIALWDQAVSWMGGGWHAMKVRREGGDGMEWLASQHGACNQAVMSWSQCVVALKNKIGTAHKLAGFKRAWPLSSSICARVHCQSVLACRCVPDLFAAP